MVLSYFCLGCGINPDNSSLGGAGSILAHNVKVPSFTKGKPRQQLKATNHSTSRDQKRKKMQACILHFSHVYTVQDPSSGIVLHTGAGSSHSNEHKLDSPSLGLSPLVILDCVKMTVKTNQFTKYV